MSPVHAQLSSVSEVRTDLYYTPPDIADRSRLVLGGRIDLDTASDEQGNKTIRAERYITREEDGLRADWGAPWTIFSNPPGGKTKNRSNTMRFWGRLMEHRQRRDSGFGHAIFLAFNLEALQATQRAGIRGLSIAEFPLCIPRKRIRFLDVNGVPQRSPKRANAIVYVPGKVDKRDLFIAAFEEVGAIMNPWAHLVIER